jgi:hypothetical protein
MNVKRLFLFLFALGLLLAACQPTQTLEPSHAAASDGADDPVAVTQTFYNWYLDTTGRPAEGTGENLLVTGRYRQSPYLSPNWIVAVDEIIAGFDQGGYDPFLQAQDIPQAITVEPFLEKDDSACVVARAAWGGDNTTAMRVDLVRKDGAWLVDRITRGDPTTPAGVAQLFYDWYLASLQDREDLDWQSPLSTRAYRNSEYLSEAFIATVDAHVSGGAPFDPILAAQDIPVGMWVESETINGAQAIVTMACAWGGNPDPTTLTVQLRQSDGRWLIDAVGPALAEQPTPDGDGPAGLVESFYLWYLFEAQQGQTPLADGTFGQHPALAPAFVERLSRYTGQFDPTGFDPILFARHVPETVAVIEASIAGDEARVLVERRWLNFESALPLVIELARANEAWTIVDVSPVLETGANAAPAEVVADYLAWSLAYTGNPGSDTFRNPLSDAAYRDSALLTPAFVGAMDEQLSGPEPIGHDLVYCAQDIPASFHTDGVFVQPAADGDGDLAQVLVRTSFGQHRVLFELRQAGDGWAIDAVRCLDDPGAVAKAFYTWYLGPLSERQDGEFVHPLLEKRYQDSGLLSERLVVEIDEALVAMDRGGADPILMAQDIPQGFSIEPGPDPTSALVHFTFFDQAGAPANGWDVVLTFIQEKGRWLIDAIAAPAAEAGRAIFVDDEFGYSFSYPADWVVEEHALGGPGMPDDWPLVRSLSLMPAEVAAALESQAGGPPDPNAPAILAPLAIEVLSGDRAALERVYGPIAGEQTEVAGRPAAVMRQDPGVTYTIFQHPTQADRWLVVTDWVTGFPGREAQAASIVDVLPGLLDSISFAN